MPPFNNIAHRPTVAEIDLDALASNFRSSKELIGADVNVMAVVKANAYGHGAAQCALRLEREGVDWFGVAIPEEGVELRKAGVARPILCLGSFWPGQEVTLIVHDLTPVIFDESTARRLNQIAADAERTINIHVKIDTGMGRVGVRHKDARSFAEFLLTCPNLTIQGMLTHFASAEDAASDDFTNLQIERFGEAVATFEAVGHQPTIYDLANSPGAFRHGNSRASMVRLGGALYGLLDDIMPADVDRPSLRPVLSLRSKIAHIKHLPAGESLGYGRTFITKRDSLIALVPIGYADGYTRALSNNAHAIVKGTRAPLVGRISMDWTLIDVTDVAGVAKDDSVCLIGRDGDEQITAADMAHKLDTIGYEITCGIAPRVPRLFLEEKQ